MLREYKLIVLSTLLIVSLNNADCKKTYIRRSRGSNNYVRPKTPAEDDLAGVNHQPQNEPKPQTETDEHKLARAPIPVMHDGPQPFKQLETRSAPIALESRFNAPPRDTLGHERVHRHIPSGNSLNPQRPAGWNDGQTNEEILWKDDRIGSSHFNHPGHTQLSNNHPTNTYNYYGVSNIYGSAYQYGSGQQPFKGYVETQNIGIIPPRSVNAKSYYSNISGLMSLPIITKHPNNGLFQSLYDSQKHPSYSYGYGYSQNAYKNVLTGILMWNIINALSNKCRYNVYNYKNLPTDFATEIVLSSETIIECSDHVTALCSNHSEPLCINNGTIFCVTSTTVPCQEILGSACVNIALPCGNCEDTTPTYMPCAANITISGDLDQTTNNGVLCVTTLAVPQFDYSVNACGNQTKVENYLFHDSNKSITDSISNSTTVSESQ